MPPAPVKLALRCLFLYWVAPGVERLKHAFGNFETQMTVGNHLVHGAISLQYVIIGNAQQWAIETFWW